MTIDSGWVKILKTSVPEAFTPTLPRKAATVFIDGQIKLMKADYIRTWPLFFENQFVHTVEKAFESGASVVVLGFDDYTYVPASKNMTQCKRNKSVPNMDFNEHDDLPATIPENWAGAIRNRTFKIKVIGFVIRNLKLRFKHETRRSVVVDFTGTPEVICGGYVLPPLFAGDAVPGRGECDIKGPVWLDDRGPLLLESTDGDFLPIAMIQLEAYVASRGPGAHVFVRRITTRTSKAVKRVASGNTKRVYEYVDIGKLVAFVRTQFPESGSPARAFASLVAVTGCDFCMNLPAMGPTKLWGSRHLFDRSDIAEPAGLMAVLLHAYNTLFQKNIRTLTAEIRDAPDMAGACALYERLSSSVRRSHTVAARTRNSVWETPRAVAHICNAVWTVHYWTLLHMCPDPLSGNFGFVLKKNKVVFDGA